MDDKEKKAGSGASVPELENEVLNFWDRADIFQKSVKREAPRGDYVFYDGPPFATGTPHYGHIVASLIKDSVPRYWTMRGYRVERRWGWDCHGLPIENIVEKELGSESKKQIEENIGVAKFNELCRSKVLSYVDDWKKIIRQLGRWADMEKPYQTMDLEFMESVWWVFKQLWDRELIYKSYRSMHICPRCETTLSQSEVTEGYKDIKDLSCIAKFELVDEPGTFVLAWTTTPWTLIGNVALAVGVEIDYVKVKILPEASFTVPGKDIPVYREWFAILSKETLENKGVKTDSGDYVLLNYNVEIVDEFKGADLLGKKYKPLFDYYAQDEKLENRAHGWQIYAGDFVTTSEGTGVVHIAPAFGEDDMNLGREKDLPFVQHVSPDGRFGPETGEFFGLLVKPKGDWTATDVEIIKNLAHRGLLFSKEKYEHSYPHCWRCDTPLLNYATSSWFVDITTIKEKILDNAKAINWTPAHIKEGRWGNWLSGARDWSISRQRFWASVMPIWECACGERRVFGSVAELEEASGQKINDLHKHIVDEVKFPCAKCGAQMSRIPDVLDTWFDSGSMPYAQMHYPFENKEKFENNFPAEFIAEGADQTRCWFYYLHAIATGVKEQRAFNNVIVNGIVLAEDGKKMSKKLQNYPDPAVIMNTYGADALRQYLLVSPVMLADNLCFSEDGVKDSLRRNVMLLWNVVKFYEMFRGDLAIAIPDLPESGQLPTVSAEVAPASKHILDRWIISRLNQLIGEVSSGMDAYNLPEASRPLTRFIDDLSTWYLRRSRDRFKGEDKLDAQLALATTDFVLKRLALVMAPFMPFVAEQVWQKVTGYAFTNNDKSVHLEAWPIAGAVETDVLTDMTRARKAVELALAKRDEAGIKIRQPLAKLTLTNSALPAEYLEVIKDEVNVKIVEQVAGSGDLMAELDTVLTDELKLEGVKRELVRFINSLRKDLGLTLGDSVDIFVKEADGEIKAVLANTVLCQELLGDTLATTISEAWPDDLNITKQVKINGQEIGLGIKKK